MKIIGFLIKKTACCDEITINTGRKQCTPERDSGQGQ
jgi:hypothetical protein